MTLIDRLLGKRPMTEAQTQLSFTRRAIVLGGAQVGVGGLLAARMAWLSIAEGDRYRLLAESNRVNLSLIPPRRGWIVDRGGKPLALNKTVFRADIIPQLMSGDRSAIVARVAQLLGLSAEDRDRILEDLADARGFQPVEIAAALPWEHYAALSVRASELPGVIPSQGFSRAYPTGAAVGHLLGYVGAASAEDYVRTKDPLLITPTLYPLLITPGYKVGKAGVERVLQERLKGVPGARRSEVTAHGKLVRELATRADVPGETVRMTIDAGLQDYAARRLGDNSGAVVAIDCATGGVLALVSMPSYDPNDFVGGVPREEWRRLSGDDHLPLLNKALQGLYPPGSTSKPATSLALLGAGVDPLQTVNCSGGYRIGNAVFHCSQRRGHGPIALERAIIKSCDIYYYAMGQRVGIAPIAGAFRSMGLGQRFDLPVPSQRFGTVPDPAWLLRRFKREWAVFDTVNASIGQGYVLVNPLQLAVMAARIATGRGVMPSLLLGHAPPSPALDVNSAHLDFVRRAMGGVVNSGVGTASVARLPVPGVTMGGKTGTAQVRRITMAERAGGVRSNESLAWRMRDHALFVGFAPVEAPRYAIAVIVEHGGWGASAAAPVARDAMTYLFDPDRALATLGDLERGWGGDLATRMARRANAPFPDPAPAPERPGTQDAPD